MRRNIQLVKRLIMLLMPSCALFLLLTFSIGNSYAEQRIVSADGSLTEIIYALGQEQKLVGVDTTSGFPLIAKTLPQIGYKRNISAEGVLSLTPTVLLATEDSGPEKIISQLEQAGIRIEKYSAKPGLDVVKQKILGVARLLQVEAKGQALWKQVERQAQEASATLASIEKPIKVMFVLSTGQGSPLVSGSDTMADAIIQLAGAKNAVQGFSGYKLMPIESIINAAPDVVLMMDRTVQHTAKKSILDEPGFKLTPAGINKRLVTMDGMLMLGFGPRIGVAIADLSKAFYPQIFINKK